MPCDISTDLEMFVESMGALRALLSSTTQLLANSAVDAIAANPLVGFVLVNGMIKTCYPEDEKWLLEFNAKTLPILKDHLGLTLISNDGKDIKFWCDNWFDGQKHFAAVKNYVRVTRQSELLNNTGALSMLAASAEHLVGRLLRYVYRRSVDKKFADRQIKLSELVGLNSVDDARELIVSSAIEDVIRGPFSGWITALKKDASITMTYLPPNVDFVTETFQRRNLWVHNRGIVNAIYLSRVDAALAGGIEIGKTLSCDQQYLTQRTDLFEEVFSLIALELWKKSDGGDAKRCEVLRKLVDDHCTNSRWSIVEALCTFAVNERKLSDLERWYFQFDLWLAKKRTNRLEGCTDAIERACQTTSDVWLRLRRAALLDRKTEFFTLMAESLHAGTVVPEFLRESYWFDEMRADSQFAEILLASQSPSKPVASESSEIGQDEVTGKGSSEVSEASIAETGNGTPPNEGDNT